MINNNDDIIGVDYGAKRIGVARISPIAKIGEPLEVLDASATDVAQQIEQIIAAHQAQACVVGLPRGLQGQNTAQTEACIAFAHSLKEQLDAPVYMVDEAGSSKAASARMKQLGLSGDIDAVAAAVFLEDFVQQASHEALLV